MAPLSWDIAHTLLAKKFCIGGAQAESLLQSPLLVGWVRGCLFADPLSLSHLECRRVDEVSYGVPHLDLVPLLRHDLHVEVDVAQP